MTSIKKFQPYFTSKCDCGETILKSLNVPEKLYRHFLGLSLQPYSIIEMNVSLSEKTWSVTYKPREQDTDFRTSKGTFEELNDLVIESIQSLFQDATYSLNKRILDTKIKSPESSDFITLNSFITELSTDLGIQKNQFFIAGDFIAYMMGKTISYDTIDIYIFLNTKDKFIEHLLYTMGFLELNSTISFTSMKHETMKVNIFLLKPYNYFEKNNTSRIALNFRIVKLLDSMNLAINKVGYLFEKLQTIDLSFLYHNLTPIRINMNEENTLVFRSRRLKQKIKNLVPILREDVKHAQPNLQFLIMYHLNLDRIFVSDKSEFNDSINFPYQNDPLFSYGCFRREIKQNF